MIVKGQLLRTGKLVPRVAAEKAALLDGLPMVLALQVRPEGDLARHLLRRGRVPTPANVNVNLGGLARRFSTVSDRFSGSWCRFPESWGQDGENGEKTGKKRAKMGEKWPKKSGGKLT